jgi:hypothetical protein
MLISQPCIWLLHLPARRCQMIGTLGVRRPDHPAASSHSDQQRQVGQCGVTDTQMMIY